jgi:hypothetical protein
VGSAGSIILAGSAESMMFSVGGAESMMFSDKQQRLQKTTISNTDKCGLTTLLNSASTALPISLPPKEAKFCHTSNILLVGRQCRCALSWLYFNSSAVGWSVGPK